MNDEDLLGYFEIHSRTERALFHRSMVERLWALAGEPLEGMYGRQFVEVHSDLADPLVRRARERMAVDTARFTLIAGFIPDDDDMRETAIGMSPIQLARHAYDVGRGLEGENASLRADLKAALEALRWCAGASDFQDGAHASQGYNKIVHPVVKRLRDRLNGDGQ